MRGIVAAAHPWATRAGVQVLSEGGNAFDAAVATALMLGVVEPHMSGPGGFGVAVVRSAEARTISTLDFGACAPAAFDARVCDRSSATWQSARSGAPAIATPSCIPAWCELLDRYGTAPRPDVFAPAIHAAERSFPVSVFLARRLQALVDASGDASSRQPAATAVAAGYLSRQGVPLSSGDRGTQPALARLYRDVAERGAGALSDGPHGEAIGSAVSAADGFLQATDLQRPAFRWCEPVMVSYRDRYSLAAPPPPSRAFAGFGILKLLEPWTLATCGHPSALSIHRLAEAARLWQGQRIEVGSEGNSLTPPALSSLSSDRLSQLRESISSDTARPFDGYRYTVSHTTHLCAADELGNVVSLTQSLGSSFGSGVFVDRIGMWLNNGLFWFDHDDPDSPNSAEPGKRVAHPMSPMIVLDDTRPKLALGASGGHAIVEILPQMLVQLIDRGVPVQDAISAGRVRRAGRYGLVFDGDVDAGTASQLAASGYELEHVQGLSPTLGAAQAIDVAFSPFRCDGGADPRRDGIVLAAI